METDDVNCNLLEAAVNSEQSEFNKEGTYSSKQDTHVNTECIEENSKNSAEVENVVTKEVNGEITGKSQIQHAQVKTDTTASKIDCKAVDKNDNENLLRPPNEDVSMECTESTSTDEIMMSDDLNEQQEQEEEQRGQRRVTNENLDSINFEKEAHQTDQNKNPLKTQVDEDDCEDHDVATDSEKEAQQTQFSRGENYGNCDATILENETIPIDETTSKGNKVKNNEECEATDLENETTDHRKKLSNMQHIEAKDNEKEAASDKQLMEKTLQPNVPPSACELAIEAMCSKDNEETSDLKEEIQHPLHNADKEKTKNSVVADKGAEKNIDVKIQHPLLNLENIDLGSQEEEKLSVQENKEEKSQNSVMADEGAEKNSDVKIQHPLLNLENKDLVSQEEEKISVQENKKEKTKNSVVVEVEAEKNSDVKIWHPLLDVESRSKPDEAENAGHDQIKAQSKPEAGNTVAAQSKDAPSCEKPPQQENEVCSAKVTEAAGKTKKEKTPLVELAEKGMGMSDILTETGEFAYISLVAVALATTFSDQWHKSWKDNYIKALCKHLKAKRGVEKTMVQFLHEDLRPLHANAYVEILKDDWMIKDNPSIVAQDLLGITIEKGNYDARSRFIIFHIAELMAVPREDVNSFEDMIVESFEQEEIIETEEQKAEKEKRSKRTKVKRYFAIGAATVGGGALIGLTGGLAAPLVATAGVALFGSGAAFLGTTAGLAIMMSMFGAAGAGLGGYKMKRRVGAIEEFEFASLGKGKDLHVVIAVSGWLTKDRLDNFTVPWLALAESKEQYTLKWESKYLKNLGDGLEYIMDSVMTMAAKEALKYTVLAGLLAAIALPAAAYGALSAIDNPWSLVTRRSVETGKELAEVLLQRLQGKRPVTLIGFSMGARVIFSALQELSIRKGSEGIVENVVLLGAPITSSVKSWQPLEKVVSGRIINGYCRGDWLLQFVYRTASVQVTNIAGLGPVNWDNRRMENIDLTDIVGGHLDYSEKIDEILAHIGIKTIERSSSPLLREMGGAAKDATKGATNEKEDPKVDVCDLLLPKSQKVAKMSSGVSRSESANSFLNECDKKTKVTEIVKSASLSEITIHEAKSEHQRATSSTGAVQKSAAEEVVEVGCDPTSLL
ncbi:uncharacterized protein [Antedon mediterranea]|uniref:uncharacterized protein n=1 Tax=Antedon mediterranea TaxID=105859 RepID=UPI003AF6A1E5